ncbi:MAG: nickel-dependent lactate racemase, partial [Armatimonadetes bacterium]|nr:nickel-dependent lactate racemase [Armatimonadota bacterium]
MQISVRYGRGWMSATLPDEWTVDVLEPAGLTPLPEVAGTVAKALDNPLGTPPFASLARGHGQTVIVVSDITRPVNNRPILSALVERLEDAGIGPDKVTVLIATGLHRAPTAAELDVIIGPETLSHGVNVVAHDGRATEQQVFLGLTGNGMPVALDKAWSEADLRIIVGLVEPHLMAGFSGGPKALCPGIAAAETIMAFHGPKLLSHPKAAHGIVDGNPVYKEAWEVARLAGPVHFSVQVVQNLERKPVGIFGGDLAATHADAISTARKALTCTVPAPADVAITSNGGYPLDHVFYQGGKGLAAAAQVVRPSGGIILVERNEEGLGSAEFARLIARMGDPGAWEPDPCAGAASEIDEWAILELAKFARHARIVNVCPDGDMDYRAAIPVPTVDSIEEALDLLRREGVIGAGP